MFIDFVYFVPGLKVGFPGIFLDWNPEMSHFRKFQPERSSGILLLDPALNRHFPSRTSSEGLDGEWTPLVSSRCALGNVLLLSPRLGVQRPSPLLGGLVANVQ